MNLIYNFSAGPAMLPKDVLLIAKKELRNWNNLGCSIMEISHSRRANAPCRPGGTGRGPDPPGDRTSGCQGSRPRSPAHVATTG